MGQQGQRGDDGMVSGHYQGYRDPYLLKDSTSMHRQLLLFIVSICFSLSAFSQLKWPSVTKTTKPWTRWWWEGNAVNKTDLSWNLQQYQQVGLGGVELTPIYGVYGYEKKFVDFLSPQWMDLFSHTLKEAKRMGLGVDLANGTGWPFGGPWVPDNDASKTIYYKTYTINGGSQLSDHIEYQREALVRTANNKAASVDTILKPVSKNKNLQALALDQIQYPGKLPLVALMAYSDNKEVINLTSRVNAIGKLDWTAPPGKWNLFAVFEGLHGKMVERAAPGGEGYAIDHFSPTASANYFKKFDQAFRGHDISYLRSFFNDSYEVDDARGQGNWTSLFFNEFLSRRSYDLRLHLPALFGKDSAEKNSRVIYDYRSVIDELLLEHFTITWKKWADSKGKMVRNQSHGSPANTLDLYSVVDIPETEGNDILRFKFATSAANVTGKKLVSSESATWLNEHFLSSWGDVKKAIDLFFLGGVNHIFYHGTEYSPKAAPWPGWLFYAAVHFQPTNPQWKDFHALNSYVTRAQSFLQAGRPDNDVLLYYPIIDRYSEPGTALLQHFDGMERNFEKTDFEHVSKWMLEKGYSFDFFSDRQLQDFKVVNSIITSGGNRYRTILLPANKLISLESMKKLLQLAKDGATILFYKKAPSDVPGFGDLAGRRTRFRQLFDDLKFVFDDALIESLPGKTTAPVAHHSLSRAQIGEGNLYEGFDLEKLLTKASVRKESMAEKGLQLIRRKNPDGFTYFISNPTNKPFDEWVSLQDPALAAALFNPMTGSYGMAKSKKKTSTQLFQVYLQLQPYESVIIQTFAQTKTGIAYPYLDLQDSPIEIKGNWTVEFLDGGPAIPPKFASSELGSWTSAGGEEVKNFSGTVKYSVNFSFAPKPAKCWLLDLGKVNETAEVILNGKKIATLIGPSFQCVIPASLLKSTNKLEIIVANLMANRIAYMDRNNIPWKIFYNTNMPARRRENLKDGLFNASGWEPLPSGLSGPVTITASK
jgi:hypothetical protein